MDGLNERKGFGWSHGICAQMEAIATAVLAYQEARITQTMQMAWYETTREQFIFQSPSQAHFV